MAVQSVYTQNPEAEQRAVHRHASEVVSGFKKLYQQLNAETLDEDLISGVYAEDMVFEDSFHRIEGRKAFEDYCAGLYENLNYCEFEFLDEWVCEDDATVIWKMHYSHPKLNKGDDIVVDGASVLRFKDKIYYHRDYFDGGQLLYEHVPLIGSLIKKLKQRLA